MKKKFLIGFAIILFIILVIVMVRLVIIVNEGKANKNVVEEDISNEVIARINCGSSFAIDAGTNYKYEFYKTNKGYKCIILTSRITIAGPSDWEEVEEKSINEDFSSLDKI